MDDTPDVWDVSPVIWKETADNGNPPSPLKKLMIQTTPWSPVLAIPLLRLQYFPSIPPRKLALLLIETQANSGSPNMRSWDSTNFVPASQVISRGIMR